jgi:hypothetical protein
MRTARVNWTLRSLPRCSPRATLGCYGRPKPHMQDETIGLSVGEVSAQVFVSSETWLDAP